MRAILTPDDLKKGESIAPGWYPAEIINYEEAVVKGTTEKPSDGSTNAIFYFKLLDGPYKGKEMRRFFNEKALGFGKNMWPLIGVPRTADGGFECSTEAFRTAIGKKMDVYIKKGNNGYDSVEDFKPLSLRS